MTAVGCFSRFGPVPRRRALQRPICAAISGRPKARLEDGQASEIKTDALRRLRRHWPFLFLLIALVAVGGGGYLVTCAAIVAKESDTERRRSEAWQY
jgi:hypothetical protein